MLRETHNKIRQRIVERKHESVVAPKSVRNSKLSREELDAIALNKVKNLFSPSDTDNHEQKKQYAKELANQAVKKAKNKLYGKVFNELDVDGDGYICLSDIKSNSKSLNINLELPEDILTDIRSGVELCKSKPEEKVDLNDFLNAIYSK